MDENCLGAHEQHAPRSREATPSVEEQARRQARKEEQARNMKEKQAFKQAPMKEKQAFKQAPMKDLERV